jgi:HlyD family secretion protein
MPTALVEPKVRRPPARSSPTAPPPGRARRRLRLALVATAIVVVAAVVLLLPSQVMVVHPTPTALRDEAVGTGFVTAKVLIGVGAKITGIILTTAVDQGDPVSKGQILAELQNTDVRSQLSQAGHQLAAQRATVATAQANLAAAQARLQGSMSALERAKAARRLADITFERARSLQARGVVPKETFDAAETAQAEAVREVENAEAIRAAAQQQAAAAGSDITGASSLVEGSAAGVELQRANLGYTIVRSPVDGYAVTRDLEPGATVVPGLPIFTLADASVIWVSANIDERELDGLRVGQPATIMLRSNPNRKIAGIVARIARQADAITEEVTVDVAFAQRPADVTLNETAEIAILKREQSQGLALPITAIVRGPQGPAVWLARSGRLQMQAIKVGIRDKRGLTEVVEGLTASDIVLMNPSAAGIGLSTGTRVRTAVAGAEAR